MITFEDDMEIAKTVDTLLRHAGNIGSLVIAVSAALRSFHSMGYRRGYADAMNDAKRGKDRRVSVHLN